jgi:hypothetical protein
MPAGFADQDLKREIAAALGIAAFVAFVIGLFWLKAPSGETERRIEATILAIGPEGYGKYRLDPRRSVDVRLADGKTDWFAAISGEMAGCRVGDRVALAGTALNTGQTEWRIVKPGCTRPS